MLSSNSMMADANYKMLHIGNNPMLMYGPMSNEPRQSSSDAMMMMMMMDNASVPDLLAENNYSNDENGHSSAEEAVFPPTYAAAAALPTTKLEEEPNPFEQSFESVEKSQNEQRHHSLRNTEMMETACMDVKDEWESSILSPSMLSRPTTTTTTATAATTATTTTTTTDNTNTVVYNSTLLSTFNTPSPRTQQNSSCCSEDSSLKPTNVKSKRSVEQPEDEEKRKNFLERNRIAALKCRQRKKQWLQSLQTKVEYLAADNEQLHIQASALRDQVIQLKTLLVIHKDCPVNQSAVQAALNRPIPGIFDPSGSPQSAASMSPPPTTTAPVV